MKRNFLAAPDAALLVIDLQKAIDHPSWGERNNPQAERNIAALLHVWRATRRPRSITSATIPWNRGRRIVPDSLAMNSNRRRSRWPERWLSENEPTLAPFP